MRILAVLFAVVIGAAAGGHRAGLAARAADEGAEIGYLDAFNRLLDRYVDDDKDGFPRTLPAEEARAREAVGEWASRRSARARTAGDALARLRPPARLARLHAAARRLFGDESRKARRLLAATRTQALRPVLRRAREMIVLERKNVDKVRKALAALEDRRAAAGSRR